MRYSFLAAALLAIGCSNPPAPPSPPSVNGSEPVTISGNEKLGWDQPAADSAELATIGYEFYLDGSASILSGVACASSATAAGFECKAALPRMSAGTHTIELAAFYVANPENKSARAGPLQVTVRSIVSGEPSAARSQPQSSSRRPDTAAEDGTWPRGTAPVVSGLDRPADLAFTPDDRLLVAERSGRVRVVRDGALLDPPALTLPPGPAGEGAVLALAVDPSFARTGFVYAIYTGRDRSGVLTFTLARFREAGDTLADAIVILDDIRAAADARAVLRFGPDRKLYAAFDNGGDDRRVDDSSSFNAKVLRINPDGTTPDDAPRKSPILLEGLTSPRGLGWHAATKHLWTATATHVDAMRWTSTPNALAIVRDALFVGSDAGLVRATLDAGVAGRIARAEDLFSSVPVRALAVRSDGAVFFATADAIGMVNQ